MRNYLRCVLANVFALAGFIICGVCFFLPIFWPFKWMLFILGLYLLIETELGTSTLEAYNRAMKHYSKYGRFEKDFIEKAQTTKYYCFTCGYRLALEDLGQTDYNVARRK